MAETLKDREKYNVWILDTRHQDTEAHPQSSELTQAHFQTRWLY